MKALVLTALTATLGLQILISSPAQAKEKTVCKVKTNDIGTIVGHGSTASDAFEDAATQCFDRREQLYKMKHHNGPDEDSGLVMIDNCANIKCG